jgi:hypothetical protein
MSAATKHPTLDELKVRAHILLKSLRGNDAPRAASAAERLKRLAQWTAVPVAQVIASRTDVRLKHALAVIALEHGFPSWESAKKALAQPQAPVHSPADETGNRRYPDGCTSTFNHWFTSYEEARAQLEQGGGFLLPYRNQFFICESGHIENVGLSPDDPDWERIGRDWVKPNDLEAWACLSAKLG